jgi:Reverse transcriptase (RNA-dependent DNA polymerase)
MTMDIKDFYLNTNMAHFEYMWINVRDIPAELFQHYQLAPLVKNGRVCVEIRRGMYGLPQAGRLANDALVIHLASHGYIQSKHTPGLFTHISRPISFCLVVDDFGVKYEGKEHAEHLQSVLAAKYQITTNWSGDLYLGLHLKWNYNNQTVDLSMPNYVSKALQRFNHQAPLVPQLSPHAWTKPVYGASTQFTAPADTTAPLTPPQVTRPQEIIGVFLYYARAIDSSMLVALGSLAAAQSNATEATNIAALQLMDYAHTNPNASVRYHASDMILHIHSDASYLSEPKARSRAGGLFFLNGLADSIAAGPKLNGAIHVNSIIMRNVLASATEAEVGALFHNAQEACILRQTLDELGHKQP